MIVVFRDETEVRLILQQHAHHLLRGGEGDVQLDIRVCPASLQQHGKVRRHQATGRHGIGHQPRHPRLHGVHPIHELLGAVHLLAHVTHQGFPRIGEHHLLADTLEQGDPDLLFQLGDMLADPGLGHVGTGGRMGKALGLRRRHEGLEQALIQQHEIPVGKAHQRRPSLAAGDSGNCRLKACPGPTDSPA